MSDLITRQQNNLPVTLDDLSKFVLIGNDKLQIVRAEISAIKKLGLAKEVHEQKLREGQDIAEMVTLAKMRMGALLNELPKAHDGGWEKRKNLEIESGYDSEIKHIEPEITPEEEKPNLSAMADFFNGE